MFAPILLLISLTTVAFGRTPLVTTQSADNGSLQWWATPQALLDHHPRETAGFQTLGMARRRGIALERDVGSTIPSGHRAPMLRVLPGLVEIGNDIPGATGAVSTDDDKPTIARLGQRSLIKECLSYDALESTVTPSTDSAPLLFSRMPSTESVLHFRYFDYSDWPNGSQKSIADCERPLFVEFRDYGTDKHLGLMPGDALLPAADIGWRDQSEPFTHEELEQQRRARDVYEYELHRLRAADIGWREQSEPVTHEELKQQRRARDLYEYELHRFRSRRAERSRWLDRFDPFDGSSELMRRQSQLTMASEPLSGAPASSTHP